MYPPPHMTCILVLLVIENGLLACTLLQASVCVLYYMPPSVYFDIGLIVCTLLQVSLFEPMRVYTSNRTSGPGFGTRL